MKIAFLTPSYRTGMLGTVRHVFNLIRKLRELGIDVDVFDFPVHPPIIVKGLHVLDCSLRNLNNYDVIHSHEGAGFLVRHKNLVEYIAHVPQTKNLEKLYYTLIMKKTCIKSQHIITPSIFTKKCLIKNGISETKPITIIPHGINHDVFKPDIKLRKVIRQKYGLDGFVALTVGQMIKRKRQEDILKALVKIPYATLIMIGKGPRRNNILSTAKELHLKVLHFNYVSTRTLVGLYNAADVYVHSSILEGFCFPILEAMACGLPIIAYNVADFKLMVGNAGILLKLGNIDEMRSSLLFLKNNKKARKKMSLNAHKKSLEYTWEKSANEYIAVYKSIIRAQ